MAKTLPTISVPGTGSYQTLEIQFQDFRGQKSTSRILLDGDTGDLDIEAIVANIDMITNAEIVTARLSVTRSLTGLTNIAQNALERNISEKMLLGFQAADPSLGLVKPRVLERSILIPAMVAAIELIDGSPDINQPNLLNLIGTPGNGFLDGVLSSNLTAFDVLGEPFSGGMAFIPAESHHITTADEVDAV